MSITYFEFLVDMIDGRDYICLLKELNKVHFYPLNQLDKNRVYEVRTELRELVPSAPKTEYVTIFELLVWLAHLYEDRAKKKFDELNEELYGNMYNANRFANILMPILNNLGLCKKLYPLGVL